MQKQFLIFILIAMTSLSISCSKKTGLSKEKDQEKASIETPAQKSEQIELINPNPENTNLIFKYELAEKTHQYLIKKYSSIFSEKDEKLIITDKHGNSKAYVIKKGDAQDNWSQGEKEAYYSAPEFILVAYYEQQHYALLTDLRYMGESWSLLLVDLNNNFDETYLQGWPHFSTTQSKFIAYNKDIYAGFSDNGIGIYSYGKDFKVKKEFILDPKQWGPQSADWVSNNEISIQANHLCDNNEECSEIKKLVLIDDQWILKENSSSSSTSVGSTISVINEANSSVNSNKIENAESSSERSSN